MLKVQHLVSVAKPSTTHSHVDSAGYQQPSRIAYIEFFVKPEVEEDNATDSQELNQIYVHEFVKAQTICGSENFPQDLDIQVLQVSFAMSLMQDIYCFN